VGAGGRHQEPGMLFGTFSGGASCPTTFICEWPPFQLSEFVFFNVFSFNTDELACP
jgi:hypothetical protein